MHKFYKDECPIADTAEIYLLKELNSIKDEEERFEKLADWVIRFIGSRIESGQELEDYIPGATFTMKRNLY